MDLSQFGLGEMASCSSQLRKLDAGAESLEEVAGRTVRFFYDGLVDRASGQRQTRLVRFYKTHPLGDLDAGLQEFARGSFAGEQLAGGVKCLTLLGTAGDRPEWNDRLASRGHRAIPLPSPEAVSRIPMIAQLIHQLGLTTSDLLQPHPQVFVDLERRTFNVFHVPQALGSPYIPAQDGFVKPEGIESVFGFGGLLPDGEMFSVILFTRVPVRRETAELFKPLGLSLKAAIVGFDRSSTFAQVGA